MRASGKTRRAAKVLALTAIAVSGATAAWALPPETGGGTATPYNASVGDVTIEGLQGQSTGSQTMTIYGYGLSAVNSAGSIGGGGSGRAKVSNFSFVKHLDPSSPGLFAAVVTSTPFKSARADINGAGGSSPFMSYCFKDVRVVGDKQEANGTSTSAEPLETVDLAFGGLTLNFAIAQPFQQFVQRLGGFKGGGPKCPISDPNT